MSGELQLEADATTPRRESGNPIKRSGVETQVAKPATAPEQNERTTPELRSAWRQRRTRPIFIILLCGVVVRALYHLIYLPWWSADTSTYLDASFLLRHGYFTDGARTPAYPLFLGLAHWLSMAPTPYFDATGMAVATAMQSLLGLAAIWLVYDTLRVLCVRERLLLMGTVFFAVLHGTCQFEMIVLSQSLSLFALVLGIWLFTKTLAKVNHRKDSAALAILTGVAFSFAVLVRPENVAFFAALILVVTLLWLRSKLSLPPDEAHPRPFGRVALLLPVAAAPMLLAWMTWNYIGIGRFKITTLTSWNMSSSVYNMFDRVGPEDRVLGELLVKADLMRNHPEKLPNQRFWKPSEPGQVVQDTYWATVMEILYRRAEMPMPAPHAPSNGILLWIRGLGSETARRYTHAFVAGERIPFVTERTPNAVGDPNAIGEYIGAVSWKLLRSYPRSWLRNVFDNFTREAFAFSLPPALPSELTDPRAWEGGTVVRNQTLWNVAVWCNRLQAPLLTVLFALTLGIAVLAPAIVLRAEDYPLAQDATVAALALGVVATFVACCMFACYMPHYGVPHWGAIVICAIYAAERALQRLHY